MLKGNADLLYDDKAFGGIFNKWRITRVKKLESILGSDWFDNKKILELGCGYGNIGLYLETLGAKVTFADASYMCIERVLLKKRNADVVFINNEEDWHCNERYDLIVNFGLIYNLHNWKRDLERCLTNCKTLALETAVTKYTSNTEFKIEHCQYAHFLHGPHNGVGTLMSAASIENVFREKNFNFQRYDDRDINARGKMVYDWREEEDDGVKSETLNSWWDNIHNTGRRFWIAHSTENI